MPPVSFKRRLLTWSFFQPGWGREFIEYKGSMVTDEDPLRGGCCFTRNSASLAHFTFLQGGGEIGEV